MLLCHPGEMSFVSCRLCDLCHIFHNELSCPEGMFTLQFLFLVNIIDSTGLFLSNDSNEEYKIHPKQSSLTAINAPIHFWEAWDFRRNTIDNVCPDAGLISPLSKNIIATFSYLACHGAAASFARPCKERTASFRVLQERMDYNIFDISIASHLRYRTAPMI